MEIRGIAARIGFEHPVLEAQGHDAIEIRVARSFEQFVEKGEFTFRSCTGAVRLHDFVKFRWETVSVDTSDVAGGAWRSLCLATTAGSRPTTCSREPDPEPRGAPPRQPR